MSLLFIGITFTRTEYFFVFLCYFVLLSHDYWLYKHLEKDCSPLPETNHKTLTILLIIYYLYYQLITVDVDFLSVHCLWHSFLNYCTCQNATYWTN